MRRAGLLALIVLVGLSLRLLYINQPMRYDESYTFITFVSRGTMAIVSDYTVPNNHIFHTLLVYLSTQLLGFSPSAIRLPALLAGLACIPVGFYTTRRLYSERVAVIAAVVIAVSSPLIEFSTNARGYTLQCLGVLLLLNLASRLAVQRPSRVLWALYVFVAVLGLYTLPTTIYALVAVALWLWLKQERERASLCITYALIGLFTFLLYSPVLLNAELGAITGNQYVVALPWTSFAATLTPMAAALASSWFRDIPAPLIVLLVIGLLLGLKHRTASTDLILLLFVVALVAVVLQRNVGFARTWLYLLPPLFILSSVGLSRLVLVVSPRYRVLAIVMLTSVLAIAVVTSGSVLRSKETGLCPDAAEMATHAGEPSQPCDAPTHYYRWIASRTSGH